MNTREGGTDRKEKERVRQGGGAETDRQTDRDRQKQRQREDMSGSSLGKCKMVKQKVKIVKREAEC